MKVTDWTWAGDPAYEEINGTWITEDEYPFDRDALRPLIIDELRGRGYKFCGFYHQDGDYGAPIIDGRYTVVYSYRGWGALIADAYEIPDEDGMAYCDWAWTPPKRETETVPRMEDYDQRTL